ncbi:uncharacterized protein [Chanodichthys erythropterus]|uniref:uncharacterized protein n=1 Tax=Chanodichthys erythropterus TaxID=933992 RepID=UPI00351E80DD
MQCNLPLHGDNQKDDSVTEGSLQQTCVNCRQLVALHVMETHKAHCITRYITEQKNIAANLRDSTTEEIKVIKVPKNLTGAGFEEFLRTVFPKLESVNFDLCKVNRHRVVVPLDERTPQAIRKSGVLGRSALYIRPKHDFNTDNSTDITEVISSDSDPEDQRTLENETNMETLDNTSDCSSVTETDPPQMETLDNTGDCSSVTETDPPQMDSMDSAAGDSIAFLESTDQPQMESLLQRRNLILQQNAEFQRCVETDRQRMQIQRERENTARIQEEAERRRVHIVTQRMAEAETVSATNGTNFQFRYSDGSYRRRIFHLDSPIQSLISFAGAVPNATEDFILTSINPALHLHSQQTGTLRECGLLETTTLFIHWRPADQDSAGATTELLGPYCLSAWCMEG